MAATDLRRERKQKRRQENRELILHAAESVIIRKGYNAMTMDDVAGEAQFSKATVYKYFPRKGELVFEIMAQYFEAVKLRLARIRGEKASAKDKLRRSILMALEFYEEKRNISRVLLMDHAMLKFLHIMVSGEAGDASPSERRAADVLKKKRREVLASAAEILKEGMATGEFRRLNAMTAVSYIDAVVHGFAHGHFGLETMENPERTADMLFRFVLHGIANPGKSGEEARS